MQLCCVLDGPKWQAVLFCFTKSCRQTQAKYCVQLTAVLLVSKIFQSLSTPAHVWMHMYVIFVLKSTAEAFDGWMKQTAVTKLHRWIYIGIAWQLPADVDVQTGVWGARCWNDTQESSLVLDACRAMSHNIALCLLCLPAEWIKFYKSETVHGVTTRVEQSGDQSSLAKLMSHIVRLVRTCLQNFHLQNNAASCTMWLCCVSYHPVLLAWGNCLEAVTSCSWPLGKEYSPWKNIHRIASAALRSLTQLCMTANCIAIPHRSRHVTSLSRPVHVWEHVHDIWSVIGVLSLCCFPFCTPSKLAVSLPFS